MSFYAKRWLPLAALPLTVFGAAGDLDTTFGGGDGIVTTPGTYFATSVALQNDEKIVVAGIINGDFGMVRYLSDGSIDTSFNGGSVSTDISGIEDGAYSISIANNGMWII